MAYLLGGGGGGGAAAGSKIGTSRSGTIALIGQIHDSATTFTSETIKTKIESGIVTPLVSNWFAEDAVLFLNSLGSIVYALTSEIAVLSNAAIGAIAGSYDSWLLSTSGQDLGEGTTEYDQTYVGAGEAQSTMYADPDETTENAINGCGGFIALPNFTAPEGGSENYKSTTGGSGRGQAYNYLSSADTQIQIDVSQVKSEDEGKVYIVSDVAENIDFNQIQTDIEDALDTMKGNLSASDAFFDASGEQEQAVLDFYDAVNQKVKDAFAAMTTGPSSLKTALEKAVESYGTVSTSIAGELGELAQGGGEGGQ